jgi:hypothetical protein
MADGLVHFTIPAQKHAWKRHPDTFFQCLPYVGQAIAGPTYAGQSPHQPQGFEVVLEVAAENTHVLVAIGLRPSNSGIYHVRSTYLIDYNTVERRCRKGFLEGL